jgi:hypothetical protein
LSFYPPIDCVVCLPWVGGTYPFRAEGLSPLRGPMSLPPSSWHGRTVQAIPFLNDQIAPGIDSIVQLEIKVQRYGHVSKVKVLSGDAEFIEDAKACGESCLFSRHAQ